VQGYVNCLAGRSPKEVLRESQVVCIGPITAATAKELGVPVSAIAAEFTIDGMLELLKALGREASTGKEI
jgi:uroporphyrinogen III methyltransferase/synthase